MTSRYTPADLKRYSLELYARDRPSDLVWKVDAEEPFAPMARGDRIIPMDAPGMRTDRVLAIVEVEHLLYTAGEKVRYVTRIYTESVEPLA